MDTLKNAHAILAGVFYNNIFYELNELLTQFINKRTMTRSEFDQQVRELKNKKGNAIRKDRIRLHFGLPQKTRLNLCYNGYGQAEHRKAVHRHVFRKHGYIVEHGSDTVYYNDETDRRPRMEARAAKYGLRVMEAS